MLPSNESSRRLEVTRFTETWFKTFPSFSFDNLERFAFDESQSLIGKIPYLNRKLPKTFSIRFFKSSICNEKFIRYRISMSSSPSKSEVNIVAIFVINSSKTSSRSSSSSSSGGTNPNTFALLLPSKLLKNSRELSKILAWHKVCWFSLQGP